MENLRWILIFAGIAILVLLYLSGRQPKGSRRQDAALNRSGNRDARSDTQNMGSQQGSQQSADPLMGEMGDDGFADPLGDNFVTDEDINDGLGDPLQRPGGQAPSKLKRSTANNASTGFGGISSKIEAIGSKLDPRRRARVDAVNVDTETKPQQYASKIVSLHVVAPEGQLMNGAHLLEQFEQRGYHFGDMNIFHSMHEGQTVFSIAKLVMPGTFDVKDVDSFQTPGISLILQLPGPVAADVAFEVLLSEAHELADAMGATVLDADRSTLSKQTVQHMREGIYEYMHRQKYFSSVPS